MSDTRYASEAARVLAAAREVGVAPPSAESREKAIAGLAAAMGDGRRVQRQRRAMTWAAAAVAVLGLGLAGARRLSRPDDTIVMITDAGTGARVFRSGLPDGVAAGTVSAGDRVAAGSGVAMRLSTGTTLNVEAASELQIVETGPAMRLALLKGAVRAKVAKLHRGERFVVATPDAEIEVRGTAFRLAAQAADTVCDEASSTRLEVFEGVVAVRRGSAVTLVGAGGVWPANCRRPEPAPASVVPAAPAPRAVEPPRPRRTVARSPALPPPARAPEASTLAEQNDLFARAVAARRRGDRQAALERFFELERRFPSSPLGEASMVERMRLVRTHDREAARAIAREYLARFPEGFAGAEARALIAEPTGR